MRLRLLTGRVVIREILSDERSGRIWTPDPKAKDVLTHRGRVLGVGPGPLRPDGSRCAIGFHVGDVVQYHFSGHHEKGWTHMWPEDGLPAVWVPWYDVDGVYYPCTLVEA